MDLTEAETEGETVSELHEKCDLPERITLLVFLRRKEEVPIGIERPLDLCVEISNLDKKIGSSP